MVRRNQTDPLSSTVCLTHQECRSLDQHATCINSSCGCSSNYTWENTRCVVDPKVKESGCPKRLVSCILVSSLVGILVIAIIGIFAYKIYKLKKTMRNQIAIDILNSSNPRQPYPLPNRTVNISSVPTIIIQTENKPPEYSTVIKTNEVDPDFCLPPTYEEALDKMKRDSLQSTFSVHTQTSDGNYIPELSTSNISLSNIALPIIMETHNRTSDQSEVNITVTVHNATIETLPCIITKNLEETEASTSMSAATLSQEHCLPSSSRVVMEINVSNAQKQHTRKEIKNEHCSDLS